jgi:hypothetical protein
MTSAAGAPSICFTETASAPSSGRLAGDRRPYLMVGFSFFSFDECFDVGADRGTPAGDYRVPLGVTAELEKLTIDLQ